MDIYLLSIVIFILGLLSTAFAFSLPYSNEKIITRSRITDYSILFATGFIILLGIYTEIQYKLLGDKIGFEVLFISSLILFLAYYFDHLVLLSIALTGLATSIEFIINPSDLLNPITFDKTETIYSILFGVCLVLAAKTFERKSIKSHFTFTYFNFAANLIFLYGLLGIIQSEDKIIYFLVLLLSGFYFIKFSLLEKSKYFFFMSILYPYIGFTYLIFHSWLKLNQINLIAFFIMSLIGFIFLNFKIKHRFVDFQKK